MSRSRRTYYEAGADAESFAVHLGTLFKTLNVEFDWETKESAFASVDKAIVNLKAERRRANLLQGWGMIVAGLICFVLALLWR